MKPFSRFYLLSAPLFLVAQNTLAVAAPVDSSVNRAKTSDLLWNSVLPDSLRGDDDFSRAVATLEQCQAAEKEAVRRAERGEIKSSELQVFRASTQRAQHQVDAFLAESTQVSTVLVSANGNSSSAAISAPRVPSLISLPHGLESVKVAASSPHTATPKAVKNVAKAPVSAPTTASVGVTGAKNVGVTTMAHMKDGTIAAPLYNNSPLQRPLKINARSKPTFLASLPQNPAGKTAIITAPVATSSLPAKVVAVTPVTLPTPTKVIPATPPKVATNAASDAADAATLRRLAALDAELKRADKRLNAANDALSEGQQQLTRFAGTLREAMLEAGPDAVGLHPFVKVAEKYAGTPYVWGGESRTGFDCSGMIIRVMRDLGYKALPHSAAEQFRYGKPIAQELLKPGDLVFFANTYKAGISHVGIYLGKRRFIHAAGTGKGTIVSSLDTAKFQQKYAGARRLISARGD